MEIKLFNLEIENFKGITKFKHQFNGQDADIIGQNGAGKTTVGFDSLLWLLFNKNSEGRTDFELHPLDEDNNIIKGLTTKVLADYEINNQIVRLHKENKERVVKNQLRGYESLYWINEVPKTQTEYNNYINSIMPENKFKMLTDLTYFNEKIHHTDRRKILLEIAGETEKPEGFDDLMNEISGGDIDEYKKVLSDRKKNYSKERDEINPRIDERAKNLSDESNKNTDELKGKRETLRHRSKDIDGNIKELLSQEKERQQQIDKINQFKADLVRREAELRSDTSGTESLIEQKNELKIKLNKLETDYHEKNTELNKLRGYNDIQNNALTNFLNELDEIRKKYVSIQDKPEVDKCYACGQKLPDNMINENRKDRENKIKKITEEGNLIKTKVDKQRATIEESNKKYQLMKADVDIIKQILEKEKVRIDDEIKKIDSRIQNRDKVKPEDDPMWKAIQFDIRKMEKKIGPTVSEQIDKLNIEKSSITETIEKLTESLAQYDRAQKDKKRIIELGNREKELAQLIADADKLLNDIDNYKRRESEILEASVNNKFKHVKFKLFKDLLSGGQEMCCETMYNGVTYKDLSFGQKIMVGIDIKNTLSNHFGDHVFLIIDHAESMTLPIENDTQTIKLIAEPGIENLQIKQDNKIENNVKTELF